MTDTTLTLDRFDFADFEIPERIPFGGQQKLVVQHFPGGAKEVQAMGWESEALAWSGRFRGRHAADDARALEDIARSGRQVTLSWSVFLYDVVVRQFQPVFERFYEVPYQIVCEVVFDHTSNRPAAPVSAQQMFRADLSATSLFGSLIADTGLGTALTAAQQASQAVLDSGVLRFAGDALAVANTVTGGSAILATASGALAKATSAVAVVSAGAAAAISGGSLVSGAAAVASAAGLTGAANGLATLAAAQQLGARLARMTQTLGGF